MPLKTLQYELSGWKGLNTDDPETDTDPRYFRECQNFDIDDQGILSKRRGYKLCATFSGTIDFLFDYQNQLGFGTVTDRQRTLVIANEVLNICKNLPDGSPGTMSIEATFSVSSGYWYGVVDDVGVCYLSSENSGIPKLLCYLNSAWIFQDATLAQPAAAPSTAAGSSTGLTGNFWAYYTYVDEWGNESPRSNQSEPVVTLANQSLDIGVVASDDPTVDHICIYVKEGSLSTGHFAGTMSNTTGTFSTSVSIAELMTATEMPEDLKPFPSGKYLAIHEDMLLVGCDPNVPDTVWCSDRQYHRQFHDFYARVVTGDADPIVGFGKTFDRSVVVKANSIHLIEGDYQDNFHTRAYIHKWGALGQGVVTFAVDRMAWFSDEGMFADAGGSPLEISDKLRYYLRSTDFRNMAYKPARVKASAYKYYRKVIWGVRETIEANVADNDICLVWNYDRNAWMRHTGCNPRVLAALRNSDDYEYLYGGDKDGNVWLFTPPNYNGINDDVFGSTTAIDSYVVTPWINFGKVLGATDWERTRVEPRYIKIYASGEETTGVDEVALRTEYWVDFDHDTLIATFDLTFSAHTYPVKRPYCKTIYYGGKVGTFNWVKYRFSNANEAERIEIHKIVFGFKLKPSID